MVLTKKRCGNGAPSQVSSTKRRRFVATHGKAKVQEKTFSLVAVPPRQQTEMAAQNWAREGFHALHTNNTVLGKLFSSCFWDAFVRCGVGNDCNDSATSRGLLQLLLAIVHAEATISISPSCSSAPSDVGAVPVRKMVHWCTFDLSTAPSTDSTELLEALVAVAKAANALAHAAVMAHKAKKCNWATNRAALTPLDRLLAELRRRQLPTSSTTSASHQMTAPQLQYAKAARFYVSELVALRHGMLRLLKDRPAAVRLFSAELPLHDALAVQLSSCLRRQLRQLLNAPGRKRIQDGLAEQSDNGAADIAAPATLPLSNIVRCHSGSVGENCGGTLLPLLRFNFEDHAALAYIALRELGAARGTAEDADAAAQLCFASAHMYLHRLLDLSAPNFPIGSLGAVGPANTAWAKLAQSASWLQQLLCTDKDDFFTESFLQLLSDPLHLLRCLKAEGPAAEAMGKRAAAEVRRLKKHEGEVRRLGGGSNSNDSQGVTARFTVPRFPALQLVTHH